MRLSQTKSQSSQPTRCLTTQCSNRASTVITLCSGAAQPRRSPNESRSSPLRRPSNGAAEGRDPRAGKRSDSEAVRGTKLDRKDLFGAVDQLLPVERLADEAGRTALLRLRRGLRIDLAAEHDHRDRAVRLLDALEHLPAVDAGHHDVEEDQLRLLALEHRHPLIRAACLEHGVPLELQGGANVPAPA